MRQAIPTDLSVLPEWQRDKPWAKLQAWFNVNILEGTKEEMVYKEGACRQIMFIRDEVTRMFSGELADLDVIGTHTSKSITLPVYRFILKNGTCVILRDNFHNWIISVVSPFDLEFEDVFSSNEKDIHHVYCEGFDKEEIFPSYAKSKERTTSTQSFTASVSNDNMLFVFLFLLKRQCKC